MSSRRLYLKLFLRQLSILIAGCVLIYLTGFHIYAGMMFLMGLGCIFNYKSREFFLALLPLSSALFVFNNFVYAKSNPVQFHVLVVASYVFGLLCYYTLLQRPSRSPIFKTLVLVGILFLAIENTSNTPLRMFFYNCALMAGFNSMLFVREVDTFRKPISFKEAAWSFGAFWNGPVFLNLTIRELKNSAAQDIDSFFISFQKGIRSLAYILPFFVIKNYLMLTIFNHDMRLPLEEIPKLFVHQTLIGTLDKLIQWGLLTMGSPIYLISVIFGGLILIFNLMFIYTLSVSFAQMCGFNIADAYSNIFEFHSLRGLFSKLYSYYSKNLLDIFYSRFRRFFFRINWPVSKFQLLFCTLFVGGLYWHFMSDVVWRTHEKGIIDLLFRNAYSVPFFFLLAASVLFDEKLSKTSAQNKFLIIIKRMALIAYFSIIFFCHRYTKFDGHSWTELAEFLKKAFLNAS